jgi:hypothetical protein
MHGMAGNNQKIAARLRRNDHDVTGRVRVSDPAAVRAAVAAILTARYGALDLKPIDHAFAMFGRLYAGWLPGYVGCDTWYHDAQHSLDCTLAMARLLDGHDRAVAPTAALGPRRAVLGVIIALFHDAGYIRRYSDSARNGAEYTLTHVKRSGDFLKAYLPRIGYADEAELAARVVHFTGYEVALNRIEVADPQDRMLGFLLGSADILAQTSDRCYIEKCRDWLYREFEICGMAGTPRAGMPPPIYRSAEDLLMRTPDYNQKLWDERLDGYFGRAYRHFESHFGGFDPYTVAVGENIDRIEGMIARKSFADLTLRPKAIGAAELRAILGAPPSRIRPPAEHLGENVHA